MSISRVTLRAFFIVLMLILPVSGAYADINDVLVVRVSHPGLMKRNISSIVQDVNGYMWFGSSSGVRRFDGRSVKVIRTGTGVDRRDINNPITDMFAMEDGTIWLTLKSGGIARVRANQNNVEYIYPPDVPESDQVYLDFRSLERKSDTELLLGGFSNSSVYVFNTETLDFRQVPLIPEPVFSEFAVTDLEYLLNGHLWVGTDLAGILVLDADFNQIAHYTSNQGSVGSLVFDSIRDIEQDNDGQIWVSTYVGGLHLFDNETETFSRPESLYGGESTRFGNVYDLLVDDENQLWVATDDGLVVLDTRTHELLYHIVSDPNRERSLVNNQVRTIFKDSKGDIWVGNENGGVHRIAISRAFRHGNPDPDRSYSQGLPVVRSFLQYDEQTLWVGTQNGGIRVLDYPSLRVRTSMVHEPGNPASLSNNGVTHMYKSNDGTIWVGTWGGGLNRYNPSSKTFTTFKPDPANSYSISDDRIQFIAQGSTGELWIGTETGLNLLNPNNGRFERYVHNPFDSSSISSNSLQTLAFVEDYSDDDVFWLGTWYGLNRFNRSDGTFKRYLANNRSITSLTSNHILTIHDGGDGYLWIGTFGGGLNRFEKETGEVKAYLVSDGLPSNVIFAILADQKGYLWLSSNNGLSRFDIQTETFRNYSENEGIVGTEFWWGSAYTLADGNMLFGSTFGFTKFNPASAIETYVEPRVVINNIKTVDREIDIDYHNPIVISYDEVNVTIEFAALEYGNPEQIQYAYMLQGLESSWNYVENVNVASYSHLHGGEYVFRVKSTDSSGIWGESEATIRIIIKHPFWQMVWFYVLMAISGITGVVGLVYFRTRQVEQQNRLLEAQVEQRTHQLVDKQNQLESINEELKQQAHWLTAQKTEIESQQGLLLQKSQELATKNEELQRINEEKNNLIGIVAHDLRSPLASIISGINLIKMQPDLSSGQVDSLLKSMEDLVMKQLHMITRILNTEVIESGKVNMHITKIDVNHLLKQMLPQMKQKAAQKSITVRSVFVPGKLIALADEGYLEQVIDNLIGNAIKFSPSNSAVIVLTEIGDDVIRIGITDSGPGISSTDQKKLFRKFHKLSARPTAGESTTGLGLSIVKRFVDAMNGRVWCESKLGEGSTFWVELPGSKD